MIKNKTRGKTLANQAKISGSLLFKSLGLMFSRPLKDKGLVFVFNRDVKISLHMFFVFFTIDVLFLDKDRKVVEIKENFFPFSVYFPRNRYRYGVELPKGTSRRIHKYQPIFQAGESITRMPS